MKILCPTCNGVGSIPDPKCLDRSMCYCGPNGESVPRVLCQTCNGSGWFENIDEMEKYWRNNEN